VTSTPAAAPVAAPLVVRTVPLDRLPGARSGEGDEPDARDLLDLLPADAPLAWVRRGDGLVGWGEAARIETSGPSRFADADAAWRRIVEHAVVRDEVRLPGTGPVAFGSFAFDDESAAGGVLVVPRVVVGRRAGRAWLTTLTPAGDLGAPPDPGALRTADLVPSPGAVQQADGALTPAAWGAAVSDAVERIRRGDVDKVVLARDVTVTAEEPVDPRWVARRLADRYASTWTFVVDGLLGATPELLVRSQKGLVTSRVLAGTIRRTGNDEADMARAGILAHSSKDLEEHEYAVASVAAALAPFCSSTNVPDVPFVLPLPNVLHLASDVTGVLAPDEPRPSSLALAAALHPSAAVCGTPTDAAREVIRAVEHMDRDRYAGPVGWLGADGDGEWGIGLRSGRVSADDPRRVRIFAGCGVVAASEPAAELAESEAKLEPMRWALGVRTR
jgi:menaquinone-specific isochorismate synthase